MLHSLLAYALCGMLVFLGKTWCQWTINQAAFGYTLIDHNCDYFNLSIYHITVFDSNLGKDPIIDPIQK